jgi:two-component system sensor histidine kinase PhoQ
VVDNACKWCRSRVLVSARWIRIAALPRRLSIVVEDDGPGIPQELRTRVIERGVRADEHVPGHGLGLAMVRDTVAIYGGQFLIDARALGGARRGTATSGTVAAACQPAGSGASGRTQAAVR